MSVLKFGIGFALLLNPDIQTIYVKRSNTFPVSWNLRPFNFSFMLGPSSIGSKYQLDALQILGNSHGDHGGIWRTVSLQQVGGACTLPPSTCNYSADMFSTITVNASTQLSMNATQSDFITLSRALYYHIWIDMEPMFFFNDSQCRLYGCNTGYTVVMCARNSEVSQISLSTGVPRKCETTLIHRIWSHRRCEGFAGSKWRPLSKMAGTSRFGRSFPDSSTTTLCRPYVPVTATENHTSFGRKRDGRRFRSSRCGPISSNIRQILSRLSVACNSIHLVLAPSLDRNAFEHYK